jgi:hypothetical protein
MAKKSSAYKISQRDVDNFETIAFMLDVEADNLENKQVESEASEINQVSVGLHGLSTVEFLRGVAQWFRNLASRIKT